MLYKFLIHVIVKLRKRFQFSKSQLTSSCATNDNDSALIRPAIIAKIDLIFIDNDTQLLNAWLQHAEYRSKRIQTFDNAETCLASIHFFDKTIPIYIDSDLGDGMKGEGLAQQLFAQGYTELFLATGHDSRDFPMMPWVKAVVGKMPPF